MKHRQYATMWEKLAIRTAVEDAIKSGAIHKASGESLLKNIEQSEAIAFVKKGEEPE